MLRTLGFLLCCAAPAAGCETALALAIDTSGSIDAGEYAIQINGLASALRDPNIVDAMVRGEIALSVVHWSGVGAQALILPWLRITSAPQLEAVAQLIQGQPRAFKASDTAIGQAVDFTLDQFSQVPDCRRLVIDVSGDGPENAGFSLDRARARALKMGVMINGIAIENVGNSSPMTHYFERSLITPGGFVITARGLDDYPRSIREKILREISKVVS